MDSIGERNYIYVGNSFKSKWLSDREEVFFELENSRILINDSLNLLTNYLYDINFILEFTTIKPLTSKQKNGNTVLYYKSISNKTLIPLSKFFENFGGVNLIYCQIELNNRKQIIANTFCFKQHDKNIIVEETFGYQNNLPNKIVALTKKDNVITNKIVQSFKYTSFR
jgi:hypothetical protein